MQDFALLCKAASALSLLPIIEEEPGYVPSKGWAERPPPPRIVQHELLMAAEERESLPLSFWI